MARRISQKISKLDPAGTLAGSELTVVVKQGNDRRTTVREIAALGSAAFYGAITISPDPPSGGEDGDLWFQVA